MSAHSSGDERQLNEALRKLESVRSEISQLKEWCDQLHRELTDDERVWLEKILGPTFDELRTDLATAQSHLCHADANVRFAALYLLISHWNLVSEYRDAVAEIAFGSDNPELRLRAIALLPLCFSHSTIKEVAVPLVNSVRDTNQSDNIRLEAYRCIVLLQYQLTKIGVLYRRVRSIEDIDWRIIDSFLEASNYTSRGQD